MTFLAPIRAVILDLDGTLVDTLGDFEQALHLTLTDLGVDPGLADRRFISLTVGKGSEYLLHQTLQHVGLKADDPALAARAMERYQHHYGEINGDASVLFPGVEEGLSRLAQQGWDLACLTNKPGRHARRLLQSKGVAHHFRHIFGGDEFARKKPDPLPLLETCRALGQAPAHTLMIGDSLNDAMAGDAAGCPVVLMTYGYNHGRPIREVPAQAYLDRLSDLLAQAPLP